MLFRSSLLADQSLPTSPRHATTNSGLFLRLSDRKTVTSANSYEVNIWDIRPDPKYGTGAIVEYFGPSADSISAG